MITFATNEAITALAGPIPLVRTAATVAAYLDLRAATALRLAEHATDTAELAMSLDMPHIAAEAMAEGRAYFAAFEHINAMRVRPV